MGQFISKSIILNKKYFFLFFITFLIINIFTNIYAKPYYPVLFMHGIGAGFEHWEKTIKKVSDDQYATMQIINNKIVIENVESSKNINFWNVSYYTPDPIPESLLGNLDLFAERLTKIIKNIQTITQEKKIIIIAHSMGGLVARRY